MAPPTNNQPADPFAAAEAWTATPPEHQTDGRLHAELASIYRFGKNVAEGVGDVESPFVNAMTPPAKGAAGIADNVAQDNPPTNALVGGISGKISPAVQGKIEGVASLFGPRIEAAATKYAQAPKPGVMGHAEAALVSGGVSLGEWAGFKEVSLLSEGAMEAVSPLFRRALVAGGLQEKLARTAVSAASVAAAGTVVGAAEGQAPTAKSIGTNMLVGGILGAAAGRYSPETAARIQGNAQQVFSTLGPDGKTHVSNVGTMIDAIRKTDRNYTPKDATAVFDRAYHGIATPVEQEVVKSIFQQHPEMLGDPEMAKVHKALFGGVKRTPPSEAEMNEWLDASESGDLLGVMFGGKSKGITKPGYDTDVGDLGFPPVTPERSAIAGTNEAFPNVQPDKTKAPTPEPFGTSVTVAEPIALPNETPSQVRVGAETEAGIPISAPGIRYALPPGSDPATAIPAAPILTRPSKLTPSQTEIFEKAKGNNWEALEKAVTKGKGSAQNFESLITKGILTPEHVTDSNVARQIAGHLIDRVEGLSPDNPKANQLYEAADDFINRSSQLRGEAPLPSGRFLREHASGDIVRTTKLDTTNSIVVDKKGKSAIVATKDLPLAPTKPILPATIALDNPESLKQLEQALGNNDDPQVVSPPKSRAGFVIPKAKGGIGGFSKGSLTLPKLGVKESADPSLNRFAAMLGGKAYQTRDGIVLKVGGVETLHPDIETATSHLRALVTDLRKSAELNQVVDNAIKTNKIELRQPPKAHKELLSKALTLAEKMTSQDEATGLPNLASSMLTPKTSFASGFTKGLATLRGRLQSMGPAGRDMASDIGWYYNVKERLDAQHLTKPFFAALKRIDELGLTVSQVRNGSGHPEALQLYRTVITPILDEQFKNSQGLGIAAESIFDRAGNVDKNYIPLTWDFKPEDLRDPQLLADMKAQGMPTDPKTVAEYFNSDGKLAAQQSTDAVTKEKLDGAKRAMNARFIQSRAASLAGNLEKVRRGNANYNESVSKSIMRAVPRNNQRLAEAAVFGPHLEKAENNIARIEGRQNQEDAGDMLNDVLGRKHIGSNRASVFLQDLARGKLSGAAVKHVWQGFDLANREGYTTMATAIAKTLSHPFFSHDQARAIGAILESARFDVVNGEDQVDSPGNAISRGVSAGGKAVGQIGGFVLHRFVNTLRTVGMQVGFDGFDRYYDKALAGDTNALAHIHDLFGKKFSVAELQQFDKGEMRTTAGQLMANKSGGTFRAFDQMSFAREPFGYGKLLAQFSTIHYQIARNMWEPLVNPNYSKAARAKYLTRLAISVPASSLLTAYLAQNVVGSTNFGQKELLHAFDNLMKDVKQGKSLSVARQAIFGELESFITIGALGIANDSIQSAIMGGSTKDIEHGLTMSPVAAGSAASIADAVIRTGSAVMYHRRSDKMAAVNAVAGVFGSVSLGAVRGKGLIAKGISAGKQALGYGPYKGLPHKESKLPRRQPIRHALTGQD